MSRDKDNELPLAGIAASESQGLPRPAAVKKLLIIRSNSISALEIPAHPKEEEQRSVCPPRSGAHMFYTRVILPMTEFFFIPVELVHIHWH